MVELLDQRFHVVAKPQELRHITQNFVQLTKDYFCTELPLSQAMVTWPCHIGLFERQYNKAIAVDLLFGADIVDIIQNRVQVFLHLCNTMSLK